MPTILLLRLLDALSSSCLNLLDETKAISMPEKKAEKSSTMSV